MFLQSSRSRNCIAIVIINDYHHSQMTGHPKKAESDLLRPNKSIGAIAKSYADLRLTSPVSKPLLNPFELQLGNFPQVFPIQWSEDDVLINPWAPGHPARMASILSLRLTSCKSTRCTSVLRGTATTYDEIFDAVDWVTFNMCITWHVMAQQPLGTPHSLTVPSLQIGHQHHGNATNTGPDWP